MEIEILCMYLTNVIFDDVILMNIIIFIYTKVR